MAAAGSTSRVLALRKLSMASAVKRMTFFDTLTDSILRSLAHLKIVRLVAFSNNAASSAVSNSFADMAELLLATVAAVYYVVPDDT